MGKIDEYWSLECGIRKVGFKHIEIPITTILAHSIQVECDEMAQKMHIWHKHICTLRMLIRLLFVNNNLVFTPIPNAP